MMRFITRLTLTTLLLAGFLCTAMAQDVPENGNQNIGDAGGYADIVANTDSLSIHITLYEDLTLERKLLLNERWHVELAPGIYQLKAMRTGFANYEAEFTIAEDTKINIAIDIDDVKQESGKKPGWIRRNALYIAAGAVLVAGSAILLIRSSSDDRVSSLPAPPGRP